MQRLVRIIIRLIEVLSRPGTPQPNRPPHIEENKWNWHEQNRNKSQQTTRPLIVQLVIHLRRKQRESTADQISRQNHARKCGSGVCLVGIDDIVQDTQNDNVNPGPEKRGRDYGDDPMHGGVTCPAEPKETNWDEYCAQTSHPHSRFGDAFSAVFTHASQIVSFLEGV